MLVGRIPVAVSVSERFEVPSTTQLFGTEALGHPALHLCDVTKLRSLDEDALDAQGSESLGHFRTSRRVQRWSCHTERLSAPNPATECRRWSRSALLRAPMSIRAVGRTGPGEHFDPDAIWIEREERVVVLVVLHIVLRRWRLDLAVEGHASLVRFVDLVRTINLERQVFDPGAVVPVGAIVRRPQAQTLQPIFKVDNLLGATVCRDPEPLLETERPKQRGVEGQRALDISDCQSTCWIPLAGTPSSSSGSVHQRPQRRCVGRGFRNGASAAAGSRLPCQWPEPPAQGGHGPRRRFTNASEAARRNA